MSKNKKKAAAKSGTFSGAAKHQRTTILAASPSKEKQSKAASCRSLKVKEKGEYVPSGQLASTAASEVKYEPEIDDSDEEEYDYDGAVCFNCGDNVEEKIIRSHITSEDVDVSKCCQCNERKCHSCKWSTQCGNYEEHGYCQDCTDHADLCEHCSSCSECRPGGDPCCHFVQKHGHTGAVPWDSDEDW